MLTVEMDYLRGQLEERKRRLQAVLTRTPADRSDQASLQALLGGLILNGLEGRKQFKLADVAPSCLDSFFRSVSV